MISLFLWYIAVGGIMFALALYAVIRIVEVRLVVATLTFLIGLIVAYVGLFSLSGLPKPVWMMLVRPHVEEALVLGGTVEEDAGIFVLLSAPELGPVPGYYWFPYSKKAAEKFQQAQRKGRERGKEGGDERFRMMLPFERTLDDREDDIFREPPQPKMPDKPQEQQEQLTVPPTPEHRL